MIITGFLMLGVSWLAAFMIYRINQPNNFIAKILVLMTFSGWVALVAGWYSTEIGRQPYLVYGVLKTADAASSGLAVSGAMIAATLAMYLAIYVFLIAAFISVVFYLAKKAAALSS